MAAASPVTLIVPCFNDEDRLPALLASLDTMRANGCAGWQVVLVDDGSTDGTFVLMLRAKLVRAWLDVVRHHEQLGRGAALRTGLERSTSPIVYAVEGKCDSLPDHLPDPSELLDADTDIASVELGPEVQEDEAASRMRRFGARVAHFLGAGDVRDGAVTVWAYRREKLRRIRFISNGPVAVREIELRGRMAGLKVKNVRHGDRRASEAPETAAGGKG
jgi:glycosyltransferase involved in cell wall biosynthesis